MQFARCLLAWLLAVLLFGAVQVLAAPAPGALGNANPQASLAGGGQGNSSSTGANPAAGKNLNLAGQVNVICTVTIAATAKAASLDLQAGEQNVSVGVVTEDCNSSNGYTVSVNSQHGGQLRSGDASAPLARYTASYDDAAGSIAAGLTAKRKSAFFGRTVNLVVSVPANAQAIAGSYSDSITVVIAAK